MPAQRVHLVDAELCWLCTHLQAFQNAADPSGRAVIGVHQDANKIFAEAPKTS